MARRQVHLAPVEEELTRNSILSSRRAPKRQTRLEVDLPRFEKNLHRTGGFGRRLERRELDQTALTFAGAEQNTFDRVDPHIAIAHHE